jgi:hypothetical protein
LAVFTLPIVFFDCDQNAFYFLVMQLRVLLYYSTYGQLKHLRMYKWNKKLKIFELNPKFLL